MNVCYTKVSMILAEIVSTGAIIFGVFGAFLAALIEADRMIFEFLRNCLA